MPDYSKAVIYKLCCKDINISDIYVGSTCNFTNRKYEHKTSCKNRNNKKHNIPVYQYIRSNGGFDNWDMILVEQYSCDSKRELEKRERFYIETLGATLNKIIPTRSKKRVDKNIYRK